MLLPQSTKESDDRSSVDFIPNFARYCLILAEDFIHVEHCSSSKWMHKDRSTFP